MNEIGREEREHTFEDNMLYLGEIYETFVTQTFGKFSGEIIIKN
jgi:hypothetical protein